MKPDYIEVVKLWINRFVIELNLCPFARKPYQDDNISYVVVDLENRKFFFDKYVQILEELSGSDIDKKGNHI